MLGILSSAENFKTKPVVQTTAKLPVMAVDKASARDRVSGAKCSRELVAVEGGHQSPPLRTSQVFPPLGPGQGQVRDSSSKMGGKGGLVTDSGYQCARLVQ